jgi:hypothetical protein
MKGSPYMIDALKIQERAGLIPAKAGEAVRRIDLTIALDAAHVTGALAHERDCLAFMLASWPWPEEGLRKDETFRMEDMIDQIADVRAADVMGVLEEVLAAIETHVRGTEPTRQ